MFNSKCIFLQYKYVHKDVHASTLDTLEPTFVVRYFRNKPVVSLQELPLHRNLELVSCLDIIPREAGLDTQVGIF